METKKKNLFLGPIRTDRGSEIEKNGSSRRKECSKAVGCLKIFISFILKLKTMVKEIEKITLTAINNGAHYNFMQTVATKAKADAKVYEKAKAQTDALVAAVKAENDVLVLSRKSPLSDKIKEADGLRDRFFRGYREGVRSYGRFPSGSQKTAADKLWQHLTDYAIEPKMQLDRQTGLMTNLVEDLLGKYGPEVALLNLRPFVNGMKAANDEVRTTLARRDTEQSVEVLGALKATRAKTDDVYRALVRRVNAYAEIEGAADYTAFIDDVNQLIRRFKQEVVPQGKKSGDGEKKPGDKKTVEKLLPAFEQENGFAPGTLSLTGKTAKDEDGAKLYELVSLSGESIWVKVEDGKLVKVEKAS